MPSALSHFVHFGFRDVNVGVKSLSAFALIGLLILFLRARPPATWVGYAIAVVVLGIVSPVVGITPRLLLRDFVLLGVVGARLPKFWLEGVLSLSTLRLAALTVASGSPWWPP